jgi:hypothetical protein
MFQVAPGPAQFKDLFPDETWTIWVHKQVGDFEWDSYGASAGFMAEGTEVTVLKRWPNIVLKNGPMAGQNVPMVRVRGLNTEGRQITGWALACNFVETEDYAAEFQEANQAGKASCGIFIEGDWARCSRPEGHEGEHVSLDGNLKVAATWDSEGAEP